MSPWTLDDLRGLDLKYAEEGVHVHQRPFRAAIELLGSDFAMSIGSNPDVLEDFTEFRPEIEFQKQPELVTSG